jgi:hypothetical protein
VLVSPYDAARMAYCSQDERIGSLDRSRCGGRDLRSASVDMRYGKMLEDGLRHTGGVFNVVLCHSDGVSNTRE